MFRSLHVRLSLKVCLHLLSEQDEIRIETTHQARHLADSRNLAHDLCGCTRVALLCLLDVRLWLSRLDCRW